MSPRSTVYGDHQRAVVGDRPLQPRAQESVARVFEQHRGFLWGLSFRLTGVAADADDIVQETFVRALARPPIDQDRDWRPWLVRVATNIGRDLLRYRRRRGYEGVWLPSPVAIDAPPSHEPEDGSANPGARYDLMESVSFAFLLALEALTPMQRAVLLLRDVFDYSAREAAHALDISEANARTTHLRARRAMRAYERRPRPRGAQHRTAERAALERFLTCVAEGNVAGVESMLASDAKAITDGGGEFPTAMRAVVGRWRVAALFTGLAKRATETRRVESMTLNGQAAVVIEQAVKPGFASRIVVMADADDDGRLACVYTVLNTRKLTAVFGAARS